MSVNFDSGSATTSQAFAPPYSELLAWFVCDTARFGTGPMSGKYTLQPFGSRSPAALLSSQTDDIGEIARKTQNLPKENAKRQRVVVFTQGKDDTVATVGRPSFLFPLFVLFCSYSRTSANKKGSALEAALQAFPTLAPLGCLRPWPLSLTSSSEGRTQPLNRRRLAD